MGTTKRKLLWVDDDGRRKSSAQALAKRIGYNPEFVKFEKSDYNNQVGFLKEKANTADLIIIDQFLIEDPSKSLSRGSSIATTIREVKKDIPIFGITAAENMDNVDSRNTDLIFEEFYSLNEMDKIYIEIKSITENYIKLNQNLPKDLNGLLKILKPPQLEIDRLKKVVPDRLRIAANYQDPDILFYISDWIRHTLLSKPGFLYDKLWVATILGIKERAFKKVKSIFKKALYKGPFKQSDKPRWWGSEIKNILYEKYSNDENMYAPWELGRNLPEIKKNDYSECYVCKGRLRHAPESVGFEDEVSEVKHSMHIRCSQLHPNYESLLYFEDYRMAGEEE